MHIKQGISLLYKGYDLLSITFRYTEETVRAMESEPSANDLQWQCSILYYRLTLNTIDWNVLGKFCCFDSCAVREIADVINDSLLLHSDILVGTERRRSLFSKSYLSGNINKLDWQQDPPKRLNYVTLKCAEWQTQNSTSSIFHFDVL